MYACGKWRNGRSKGCIFTFICEHFLGNFLGIRYRLKPRTRETRRFVLAGHLARTRLAEGPTGPVGFRKRSQKVPGKVSIFCGQKVRFRILF